MAKASVLKPKKKKTARVSRRVSGFAAMPTDSWQKAKWYVHYELEGREWGNAVREYIKNNLTRPEITAINALPDWKVSAYSHWALTAYWLTKQLPVPLEYLNGFKKFLGNLVEEGRAVLQVRKKEEKAKRPVEVVTIQDRIAEQAQAATEAIEEWLDGFLIDKNSFDPKGFDFTAHFSNFKISQAHARKILNWYQGELEEAKLIVNKPTPQQIAKIKDPLEKDHAEQIREGYAHLTKKDAQTYLTALETLAGACMLVIDASKATRKPRVKKAPSKEKVVANLKYKASDDKYQIASVNPIELIEATEIWVFNTKTRKLGKYVAAEDAKVMTVKGSTIIGYDETKSIQKTLRKPEETLKEFKAAGKIKLRKFLEEIKTTDTKLSGRLNLDTVILKTST